MKKHYLLLPFAMVFFSFAGFAQLQPCGTNEASQRLFDSHPELRKHVYEESEKKSANKATSDTTWYNIPVVVHVLHNFGYTTLSDNYIFKTFDSINTIFSGQYSDTSNVIQPFKKWIGSSRIRFRLANIDPYGNPTKGITRHVSYLANQGGDQAKLDDWDRAKYLNIWIVNNMNSINVNAASYTFLPSIADEFPMYDGIVILYDYFGIGAFAGIGLVIQQMGHFLNLRHLNEFSIGGTCGDDGVDDTPPLKINQSYLCSYSDTGIYDTTCAAGYFKVYHSDYTGFDSLVDYPDTINAQNFMIGSYCANMFTKGQIARMENTLNNTVAERNKICASINIVNTGVLFPRQDLKPTPEFEALTIEDINMGVPKYFAGSSHTNANKILFLNTSWNDTISKVRWQFSNSAAIGDTTMLATRKLYNSFSEPGWASVTLTVTDTNGASIGRSANIVTKLFPDVIFIADSIATDPSTYYMEFTPSSDVSKYPIFNYYNNNFKWQLDSTAGFYDTYCIKYNGFDTNLDTAAGMYPYTGAPGGDFDDFFTVPFNLSGFDTSKPCYLNFYYSGANRSSIIANQTDSLEIQVSANNTLNWTTICVMKQSTLSNIGTLNTPFTPTSMADWLPKSIDIPNKYRNSYTLFRFRYHPGNGTKGYSSGNNFYLDRLNISNYPANVNNVLTESNNVVLAPNPTHSNAYIILNSTKVSSAAIIVSDITGKTIYKSTQAIIGTDNKIEIPQKSISTKGIYLVQTISNSFSDKQLLLVD